MGTSNVELERACKNIANFQGVFASDELPDTRNWPPNSSCIFNYDPRNSARGGSHWVAAAKIGRGSDGPPEWFDSFGTAPDAWESIFKVDTNFRAWMEQQSRWQGHKGAFYSNRLDLQCVGGETHSESDVCGEYAVLFLRRGLPVDPVTGNLRHQWRTLFSFKGQCWQSQRLAKKLANVR